MHREIMVQYTSKYVSMLTHQGTIASGWIQVIVTNRILQIITVRNNKYTKWSQSRYDSCVRYPLSIILRDNTNTILINQQVFHFIKPAHYIKIKQALIYFGYIKNYSYSQ